MKCTKKWKILVIVLVISMIMPGSVFAAPEVETTSDSDEIFDSQDEDSVGEQETEDLQVMDDIENEEVDEVELVVEDEDPIIQEPTEKPKETEVDPAEIVIDNSEMEVDSNEALIASQEIVKPPAVEKTFRFMTVKKNYAIAKKSGVSIYEEKDKESRKVGSIKRKGLFYILSEEEDGWVYAESGKVRGFIRANMLITGEEAEEYVKQIEEKNLNLATPLVEPLDNAALSYTQTTVYETVVKKRYAIAKKQAEILDGIPDGDEEYEKEEKKIEEKNMEEEVPLAVGVLEEGALCYILADSKEDWVYVESGDVRGFVDSSLIQKGKNAKRQILKIGEENFLMAQENLKPEENKACYYTLTSVQEASVSGLIRTSMLSFAEQFIGNTYVWGGTSLTDGADCSGFVQSIYGQFGYSLPRVACDQAYSGIQIPVADAAPGDLIFYANKADIYHVVMSLGNDQTIEAQGKSTGIVFSTVDYDHAIWATRIISNEDTDILDQLNTNGLASEYNEYMEADAYAYGSFLGNFKLTAYCSCPVCCGTWSGGPTANGAKPIAGRTVAMAGIPFGTKLIIGGLLYTVEDRGTPYGHVDIYMNHHTDALNFGLQYGDVYLAE